MKKSSFIFFISSIISIIAIIGCVHIAVTLAIPRLTIGLCLALYIPFCLVQLGLFFRSIESKPEKEFIIKEIPSLSACNQDSKPTEKEVIVNNESIHSKWSKAMYDRFGERWTVLFSNATYPADKTTRGEICVELWKIASLTMDYLLVANNDPNALKRNKEMTNAVIEGLDLTNDVDLKEFFEDPTSVQQKVFIIKDILSSQLAAKQFFEIPVFGYKVELGKNNNLR